MGDGGGFARSTEDGLDRPVAGDAPDGTSVVDDDAIAKRYADLGHTPASVEILPRNFLAAQTANDFVFEQMTPLVQKLGRSANLTITVPGPPAYKEIHEKDAQIVAPTLVFAHAFLVEGGAALVVNLLERLATYIKAEWGSKAETRTAALDVIVSKGKQSKRIRYRGPVSGLPSIASVASTVFQKNGE